MISKDRRSLECLQQLTVREYAQKHKNLGGNHHLFNRSCDDFLSSRTVPDGFLHSKPVLYAFTAGMVGFLAASVGSLPGFF